jgi:hypothetical protein
MVMTLIVIALCWFLWATRDSYSEIEDMIKEHEANKKAIKELQDLIKAK